MIENRTSTIFRCLACCMGLLHCTDGEAGRPGTLPVATAGPLAVAASALNTAPVDPCARLGSPTCADAVTRGFCEAGSWTTKACAEGELCLDGRCAVAPVAAPPAARLRAVTDQGFLTAWSMVRGLPTKAAEALFVAADDEFDKARSVALCQADHGWVSTGGARSSSATAVLSGLLLSGSPRELEIRAATQGKLTIRLGAETLDVAEMPGRDGRPLVDERFFRVRLAAGQTELRLKLEPDSGGFYLRFRELDGQPARGLLFAERSGAASCAPEELLDADLGFDVARGKLQLDARVGFVGLVPLLPKPISVSSELRSKGSEQPATVFSISGSDQGLVRHEKASFAIPEKGGFELSVKAADRKLLTRRYPAAAKLWQRFAAAERAIEELATASALPASSELSLRHHLGVIAAALTSADADVAWLGRHTDKLFVLLDKAKASAGDPYAAARGVLQLAYRSKRDDKPRPYVAYVPPSYDKRENLALVLVMHGRDRLPEHALRTLVGEAPDEHMTLKFAARNLPAMPDFGAVLAAPSGFGDAGVQGIGEVEVLDVIDDLRVRFPKIDPRRVSVTGYSLGGTVAFALPFHFPDRFAAAAPLCGYPNLLSYQSVSKVPHAPWEEALLEKEYLVRYAENGLHVPLFIVHGGKDVPGRSKVVADRYKELSQSRVFDVPEDLDHNVWDYAYENGKLIPWLARHEVPLAPAHVRLATGKLRYNRAHWVELRKMRDSSLAEGALIEARYSEKERRIEVSTRNTLAMRLDLPALLGPGGDAVDIVVDGVSSQASGKEPALLQRNPEGRFELVKKLVEEGKRPGLSGPLDDYQFGPTVIVVGTEAPNLTEAHRLLAEELSSLAGSADVRYPIVDDVRVEPAALAGKNVILLGGPLANRWTRDIAPLLPVKFEASALTVAGRRHAGSDLAVAFIAPGPESFGAPVPVAATDRYVIVFAGFSAQSLLASRMLPRYLPDYVVFDSKLAARRGGLLMEDRPTLAAGFFNEAFR